LLLFALGESRFGEDGFFEGELVVMICNRTIENLKVQREEIDEIKFFSVEQLINFIETRTGINVVPIKHFLVKILNLLKEYPINDILEGE